MLTRTVLLKMADSATMRSLVESRGWRFASRFVAGKSLDEAIVAIRHLNEQGIQATLSHLGEHVSETDRARREAVLFTEILQRLSQEQVQCGISVKPSQVGLAIDPAIAEQGLRTILDTARTHGKFVRMDMEDSPYTERTLAVFRSLRVDYENVGIVIQAYLHRSRDDINALNEANASVRLCKGAYKEPAEVAIQEKSAVDENFLLLTRLLLHNGTRPAFATHDESMIQAIKHIAGELAEIDHVTPRPNADRNQWEFQMLYGVRRDLQASLSREGYRVRTYVPYGTEWYPYFMRRLAERPANVAFILRNLRYG